MGKFLLPLSAWMIRLIGFASYAAGFRFLIFRDIQGILIFLVILFFIALGYYSMYFVRITEALTLGFYNSLHWKKEHQVYLRKREEPLHVWSEFGPVLWGVLFFTTLFSLITGWLLYYADFLFLHDFQILIDQSVLIGFGLLVPTFYFYYLNWLLRAMFHIQKFHR
jgi:hypothetical protein